MVSHENTAGEDTLGWPHHSVSSRHESEGNSGKQYNQGKVCKL